MVGNVPPRMMIDAIVVVESVVVVVVWISHDGCWKTKNDVVES